MVKSSDIQKPAVASHPVRALDGSGHSLFISEDGTVYSWGRTNALGKLGRRGNAKEPLPATFIDPNEGPADSSPGRKSRKFHVTCTKAFAGGFTDSGHSAVLDSSGNLWLTGCDRWQQLGLGSPSAGAAGYTWKGGATWQEAFQRNDFLPALMEEISGYRAIRDVALGGDHSLVLSANKQDVFSFGKGGEGQLGLAGKPWVSTPSQSKQLSSKNSDVAAVCAIEHCSLTLDDAGNVLKKAGQCSRRAASFVAALKSCRERAQRDGLLLNDT